MITFSEKYIKSQGDIDEFESCIENTSNDDILDVIHRLFD